MCYFRESSSNSAAFVVATDLKRALCQQRYLQPNTMRSLRIPYTETLHASGTRYQDIQFSVQNKHVTSKCQTEYILYQQTSRLAMNTSKIGISLCRDLHSIGTVIKTQLSKQDLHSIPTVIKTNTASFSRQRIETTNTWPIHASSLNAQRRLRSSGCLVYQFLNSTGRSSWRLSHKQYSHEPCCEVPCQPYAVTAANDLAVFLTSDKSLSPN